MDEFERGLDTAKKKFDTFSSGLKSAGEKISTVGGTVTKSVTLPLAGAGVAAGKMYMGFEDAMAKVDTIADTTQVPLNELQKSILALSNQTGISSSEIANNVYDAISAGQKTGDAVNFVSNSSKLAKAGFAEAGDALDILTTIMNAYGLEADKVTDVSDMLIQTQNLGKTTVGQLASAMGKVIPTAKAQGVQLDDLSGAYAVMTSNGIATAESTTYLNSMLNELGKQGTTASKAFAAGTEHIKAGGLTMKEAMDSGWELTDVLSILDEQAFITGTSISNMFGSAEAGKAAAVLWDNAENLNEYVGKMRESSGATEIAFEKLQTKSVTIEKAINQLKNTMIDLGGTVMSVIAPVIESLSEKIASFTEWFANLDDGSKKFIVILGLVAAAIGPVLSVIGKIVSGIGGVASAISGVVGIGSKLMGGLSSLFSLLASHPVIAIIGAVIGAIVLLYTKCEWFRDMVHGVIDAVVGFFQAAWEVIQAAWGSVVGFFSGIVDGIKAAFEGMGEFLGSLFEGAWEAIQNAWNAAVDFFRGIWEGIKNVFSVVADVLGGFFTAAWEAIKKAWDAAVKFFSDVWAGIQKVFADVAKVLGGFFSSAWEAIKGVWNAAVGFFTGIWQGIQEVFSTVAEVLGGFFSAAWEAVKSVWDAAVGVFQGIANGIHAAFAAVTGFLSEAFSTAWNLVSGVWNAAVGFFQGVWAGISGVFSSVAAWFGGVFSNAWNAVTKAWGGVTKFFQGVWRNITGVFSNAWSVFTDIGGAIVRGLWNGITALAGWLWSKVTGFFGSIVDGVKGMLGIASPSKVFASIGGNMARGIGVGWDKEYAGVERNIENGLGFGNASAGISHGPFGASRYNSQAGPGAAGAGRGDTVVNIYSPEAVDGVQAARVWRKEVQKMAVSYM